MRIWHEAEKDIENYFTWFKGKSEKFSVYSLNGAEMFTPEERSNFIEVCARTINKVFKTENFTDYKLYLLANVEVSDKNSRIEKYKKVWKKLESEFAIDSFTKGPEIEITIQDKLCYSSIAMVEREDIPLALDIISKAPHRHTIFASKKENILDEDLIRARLNEAIGYELLELDYEYLINEYCPEGDILFRWGEVFEEAEIALIFKNELYESFQKISQYDDIANALD
ncbi:hypothetical protein DCC39_14900 [Pueribacillus theae]|uniref:DUF3885 domain-containing protein n=1 Tax=Pueribacillus theae TaxID=2171751 RepID=A0A2U1JTZ6_9BACI|nr:hypothetical protein [Pueribacillus theae]PWA08429.1 hypothetical protein DCC39_14900 [Pueribacillus theae]